MQLRSLIESGGHQAAIAASLALFAGTLGAAILGHDQERDVSLTRLAAARAVLASNPSPELPPTDWSAVTTAWSRHSVVAPAGGRAFVATPRTRVVPNVVKAVDCLPPASPVLRDPPAPAATSGPGHISLQWPMPARGTNEAAISEIRISRRVTGGTAFETVATLKPGSTSWDDESVAPRRSYDYRLQFHTDDPRSRSADSSFSPTASATCSSGVELRFTGGSESGATIVVRKWIDGAWAEGRFAVVPREETSGHSGAIGEIVTAGGKKTDFSTGFVLVRVTRATRHFLVRFQENKWVGNNLEIVPSTRIVSREALCLEYLDDSGSGCHLWMDQAPPTGGEPAAGEDR
ncbi:MAG: hypothetical protein K8T20_09415 [Planctomycetes bacterium]|nr:hypothetical protein [Planctomycetota bacterium]